MRQLIWLQSGGCGGDTLSLLNAETPDLLTALRMAEIRVAWHPSLSLETGGQVRAIFDRFLSGETVLDFLILEGSVLLGPGDTGNYHRFCGRPFKDWIAELAGAAEYTLAVGACAAFGGITAAGHNHTDAVGLQFSGRTRGGLLGEDYVSRAGFPVINISGCPVHPAWVTETLLALAGGGMRGEDLDRFQRPRFFFNELAHVGCPRNEFFEFRASAEAFGQQGCMFEHLGCRGTVCEADCNVRLWMGRTGSCTRGGYPCIACTSPDFPDAQAPYLRTEKIANIPTTLPRDVPKAWYVALTGLAKACTPQRLKVNAISSHLTAPLESREKS